MQPRASTRVLPVCNAFGLTVHGKLGTIPKRTQAILNFVLSDAPRFFLFLVYEQDQGRDFLHMLRNALAPMGLPYGISLSLNPAAAFPSFFDDTLLPYLGSFYGIHVHFWQCERGDTYLSKCAFGSLPWWRKTRSRIHGTCAAFLYPLVASPNGRRRRISANRICWFDDDIYTSYRNDRIDEFSYAHNAIYVKVFP